MWTEIIKCHRTVDGAGVGPLYRVEPAWYVHKPNDARFEVRQAGTSGEQRRSGTAGDPKHPICRQICDIMAATGFYRPSAHKLYIYEFVHTPDPSHKALR